MARRAWRFLKELYLEFSEEGGSYLAATISYYSLFSLFPLILLFTVVLGFFVNDPRSVAAILAGVERVIPEASKLVQATLEGIVSQSGAVGLVGLAVLVYAATGVFSAVEYALCRIWRVEVLRPIWWSKLLALGYIVLLGLLVVISLASTNFVALARGILAFAGPAADIPGIYSVLTWFVGFLSTVALFYLTYRVVPRRPLTSRDVWVGTLAASLAWEAAKFLFAFYLRQLVALNLIYGSVAAVIGLLLWFYFSAMILLLGAQIDHVRLKLKGIVAE